MHTSNLYNSYITLLGLSNTVCLCDDLFELVDCIIHGVTPKGGGIASDMMPFCVLYSLSPLTLPSRSMLSLGEFFSTPYYVKQNKFIPLVMNQIISSNLQDQFIQN